MLPHPLQLPLPFDTKRCVKCGQFKRLGRFPRDVRGFGDGYKSICKDCVAATARERRAARHYEPSNEPQRCTKCGEVKTASAFSPDPLKRNGLKSTCRGCNKCVVENPVFVAEKVCTKCKRLLPIDRFKPRNNSRDGHHNTCKDCQNARGRERWANAPERHHGYGKKWRTVHRDRAHAIQRAYREANKERIAARAKEYAERTREQKRVRARAYYLANKDKHRIRQRFIEAVRRARKRENGGTFTRSDIEAMYTQQEGLCAYCHCALNGVYDIEHKVPLCRGGSSDPSNLALACEYCNSRKHTKTDVEFLAMLAAEAIAKQQAG